MEPYLTNMEARSSLQYCSWPKIHEQVLTYVQVRYRCAKAMNCFPANAGIFFGLLHVNDVELVGSIL